MEIIVIILSILLFAAIGIIIATKLGKFNDSDADGIPDEVEDFVEDKIDDASASNIVDEEQAMWAAYAAADYATDNDEDDEYDEDADIEDSLGIGSW